MATHPVIQAPLPGAKRKIAIFLPCLGGGGAERAMLTVAGMLADKGCSVDLVLCAATGAFTNEAPSGVHIIGLGRTRVSHALFDLARYLRLERPEVLLSSMPHCNLVALLAGRLAGGGTRIVVNEQASAVGCWRHESRKYRLMRLGTFIAYRWASAVVTVSEAMTAEFPGSVAIHNPIDLNEAQARAFHMPIHPWSFGPYILAAGRLVPQKDFPTLIRAFARMDTDAKLIILGEGPDRPKLERLIRELGLENHVSLPGFDPNPFAYMKRAKLFVLSSRYEGLPGVLIQAMACGCPVVATDCPTGPREILQDGRWGDLVPVGDPAALAAAMTSALARDVHPDVQRRAADYDEDKIVDQYLKVLLPA